MTPSISLRIANYAEAAAKEYDFSQAELYFDELITKDEAMRIVRAVLADAEVNNSIVIDRLDIVDGKAFDLKTGSIQYIQSAGKQPRVNPPAGDLTYMFYAADSTNIGEIQAVYNEVLLWGKNHRSLSTDGFLEKYDPVTKP